MSIEDNWDKLFNFWREENIMKKNICRGATFKELENLKKYYKDIPEAFLKSLQIYNSLENIDGEYYHWLGENGWGILYNIDFIIKLEEDAKVHRWFDSYGTFDTIGKEVENPKYSPPKEWIPIYSWNGDYEVAIDMSAKNTGQIIVYSNEDSIVSKWSNSYEEWFEIVVNEVIKFKELRVETIEEILYR